MGGTAKRFRLAGALALVAVAATACGTSEPGSGTLSGTISGVGSSTVGPITEAIAEEFRRENPSVQVPLRETGTGGGFEAFCIEGSADLTGASRPIKTERSEDEPDLPAEAESCEANDIDYVELQVAVDGLTVVVNPENDWAECLTVAELSKIWGPDSEGKVTRWSQVRDGFPNEKISLFGPGSDSGTFDYFTDEVNGEEGAQRTDYQNVGEDDNKTVTGVADNLGGIGYFGYSFYATNADKVKAVAVDGGSGCVEPSEATVKSNEYSPLSRPLFVYVRTDALARPEVAAFMEFYLDTVNSLIADVGYVGLDDAALAEEQDELRQATA